MPGDLAQYQRYIEAACSEAHPIQHEGWDGRRLDMLTAVRGALF
jgi:hypothetical protein